MARWWLNTHCVLRAEASSCATWQSLCAGLVCVRCRVRLGGMRRCWLRLRSLLPQRVAAHTNHTAAACVHREIVRLTQCVCSWGLSKQINVQTVPGKCVEINHLAFRAFFAGARASQGRSGGGSGCGRRTADRTAVAKGPRPKDPGAVEAAATAVLVERRHHSWTWQTRRLTIMCCASELRLVNAWCFRTRRM